MFRDLPPSNEDTECPPAWRSKTLPFWVVWQKKIVAWFKDQTALVDALAVAVMFHVLLFPLIWFVGWALPWPKAPEMTTVIEINLEHWPVDARPESIEQLYTSKLMEARRRTR